MTTTPLMMPAATEKPYEPYSRQPTVLVVTCDLKAFRYWITPYLNNPERVVCRGVTFRINGTLFEPLMCNEQPHRAYGLDRDSTFYVDICRGGCYEGQRWAVTEFLYQHGYRPWED